MRNNGMYRSIKLVHGMRSRLLLIGVTAFVITCGLYGPCMAMSVFLQWDPNPEPDLVGYKVYYMADTTTLPFSGTGAVEGTSPIDLHNQTFATISGLDPAHSYSFAVTAYNSAGVESSYSNIVDIPEYLPPSVSVTFPGNNSSVSGTVSVTVGATDNVGVSRVEFYLDGVLKGTDTTSPYLYSWDTTTSTPGLHTLIARAYDAAGNFGESSAVTVTVVNDIFAPAVSLTSPAAKATVSGTVSITASASDNIGVSRVEFYLNNTIQAAVNTVPYSYNWNTVNSTNGSYILSAKAYDAAGNIGQSNNVLVTVLNDIAPPSVSINSPINNAIVSGMVAVTATASDDVGVTKVEFYVNGSLKATSTVSPYNYSLDTTSLPNGMLYLVAKAYDSKGKVSQASIDVNVNNVISTPVPMYTISDATLALQIAVGKVKPTNEQKARLDVAPIINGKSVPNGKIDTGDAIVILSKVVGKTAI